MYERTDTMPRNVVIRPARTDDERPLRRLAALDNSSPIGSAAMVAEVGGELRAAISLRDGRTVADPFHRTARIVRMLAAGAH